MYLAALYQFYERMAQDPQSGMPPEGMSAENIHFVLVINENGVLVGVKDLRNSSGKATRRFVPASVSRSSNIAANFLWDKSSYVLGIDGGGCLLYLLPDESECGGNVAWNYSGISRPQRPPGGASEVVQAERTDTVLQGLEVEISDGADYRRIAAGVSRESGTDLVEWMHAEKSPVYYHRAVRIVVIGWEEVPSAGQFQTEEGNEIAVYGQAFYLYRLSVVLTAPGHLCLRGDGVGGEGHVGDGRVPEQHFSKSLPPYCRFV